AGGRGAGLLFLVAVCGPVSPELARFARGAGKEPAARAPPPLRSFPSRRRLVAVVGGLAAAAVLVFAVRVISRFSMRWTSPEFRELVAAVAKEPTRPVEGRLAGGFEYAPPPVVARGSTGREASPDVRIAAARIEKLVRAHDTPENEAALGVAFLAVGDPEKAVGELEQAVARDPSNARFQCDLAAAYLARSVALDRPDDPPRALAAADRAIRADAALAKAHFNRALALEALHLTRDAADAWTAYARLDSSSPWAAEARPRADRLKEQSSTGRPSDLQVARQIVEDELLGDWGAKFEAGDLPGAQRALDRAAQSAGRIAAAGGDTMAVDEVAAIGSAVGEPGTKARALARGHILYALASLSLDPYAYELIYI